MVSGNAQPTDGSDDCKAEDPRQQVRRVLFISHGNPEDNEFTSWLGSRLTAAGYEVWTDLTRLIGGEPSWSDINVAIRQHTAKLIVVLSLSGLEKEGVTTEIDIGKAVAKRLQDNRFIIPVKIDDLPYDEVMPQMMGRNIINFSRNWNEGLSRVLRALERDNVPRSERPDTAAAHRWLLYRTNPAPSLEYKDEDLVTNWYLIRELPKTIFFYDILKHVSSLHEVASLASEIEIPAAEHERLLVGFGRFDEFQGALGPELPIKTRHTSTLDAFLNGDTGEGGPIIQRSSARNIVTSLLRQGFDRLMRSRGLREYQLTAAGKIWWVPRELGEGKRITFKRPDGSEGWRILVGRSERFDRYWHFGVYAVPKLTVPAHFVLRPHVVFSRDGGVPEGGMLRRAFCKNWFNARWRDLLFAFVQLISDGDDAIALSLGGDEAVLVNARPLVLTSPVRIPPDADQPARRGPTEEGDVDDNDGLDREGDPFFRSFDGEVDEDDEPDGQE